MAGAIDRNKVLQICILVKDVKETGRHWADFLQVEMPEVSVTEKYDKTQAMYLEKPCNGRIYQCVFELENIQIEVVEPVDDEPSFWSDYLREHGEGVHHIAFLTKDMDAAVRELSGEGCGIIQRGSWPADPADGQYAYFDTLKKLKCCVELLQLQTNENKQ